MNNLVKRNLAIAIGLAAGLGVKVADVAGAPAAPAPVPGWPAGIVESAYLSSADGSSQPCLVYDPRNVEPAPLLVALHTWSGDYRQKQAFYADWCIKKGWAMVHPNFRGPNSTPEACGSDLAVQDVLSAVAYAREIMRIDPARIYVVGVSGGGHMAMLLANKIRKKNR